MANAVAINERATYFAQSSVAGWSYENQPYNQRVNSHKIGLYVMVGTTDPASLLPRFGLSEFRPGQRSVIDALSAGDDVMCVMPTGGGKSLCYQLPSLMREGTTIVVSPLIALMKDQVDALHERGIPAALINSSLSASEQTEVMEAMAAGQLDMVYVAPERLRNGRFLESLSSANVTLLAVDEAHCVSEWGHDFRPDYSRLGFFRQRYLNDVQTIALTATATPVVRDDIIELLRLKSPKVFVTGFARENLRFSVADARSDKEKDDQLCEFLSQQSGSGIIYAATRKRCQTLADWLPERVRRPIGMYHAGMDPEQRRRVQDDFMQGKLSAIVATNAFGMGIDKADIRYVVHYNMPGSLEAYYQEAGRAGRDGQASDCRLLFSYSDRYIQEFFIENRYPSKETVQQVYEFLLACEDDPIELTLDQVRSIIGSKDSSEAIGTAETLLARAGVLKRLDSNSNQAVVRIDSDVPHLVDMLPKEAKVQRRVIQAVESIVGSRRGEDVYIRPDRLAQTAGVDRDQLARALRELKRLQSFDYVPPFRGRAVHIVRRDLSFEQLEIDFEELERRKQAEYAKLDAVIGFARTSVCRQQVILNYFGESNPARCGTCDRCDPHGTSDTKVVDEREAARWQQINREDFVRGIRIVLSGITRMHGRFGKMLVAQMLCGSKNKKLQQWKLHRLSTYGLLSNLKQSEVVRVIDALAAIGLVEQKEVDERRPTIHITDSGRQVMHQHLAPPEHLSIPFPVAKRLALAASKLESQDVQTSSRADSLDTEPQEDGDQRAEELLERLKRWRRKISAALGIPSYRVMTNATLQRVAQGMPQTTTELEAIKGIGPATIEQFGYDIIELIKESTTARDQDASGSAQTSPASSDKGQAAPNDHDDEAPLPSDGGIDSLTSEHDATAIEPSPQSPHPAEPPRSSLDLDRKTAAEASAAPMDQPERACDADATAANRQSDAYWTWRLFRDGYDYRQIAEIRRCDLHRLQSDLAIANSAGYDLQPHWLPSTLTSSKNDLASEKDSPGDPTGINDPSPSTPSSATG